MAYLVRPTLRCIFLYFFCQAEADRFLYRDTVIIQADRRSTGTRTKRQFFLPIHVPVSPVQYQHPAYGAVAVQGETGAECTTPNRERGTCARLSDCYPVLYTRGHENGLRNLTNLHLAEELMISSGLCSSHDASENIICCPTTVHQSYPTYELNHGHKNLPQVPNCGTRVVGGSEAPPGTYPWMAALMTRGRQFCGGSLIDSQHIMTAAHCVQHMTGQDIENLRVYLSAHNVNAPQESSRKTYKVIKVLYNKGFSHRTLHDDVAILRLASNVDINGGTVRAICLSSGSPPYDSGSSQATLAGWGKLGSSLPQSPNLRHVILPVLQQSDCRAKYGSQAPAGITNGMVCAGGGGRDACQGDSGGPLMRPLNGNNAAKTEQIGIVSWGIGCGTYPGVYTRVDKYVDWLNRARAL